MFTTTFTLGNLMIVSYFKMRRALRERPDDPKLKLGAKILWMYPVGAVLALAVATTAAIDWLRVTL